ncbi:flagellar filament capping protein FliD [Candidatus Symbiopectobacterium sp. NZEC151]|uniref:flagellar filament capping protein FliD n=3 Tax=unclassified Symbiopectobacterium TaxID=2794573 RepID=UPI0022268D9D|nr:flagellar filament capping protein FliD [Candidatus Symbiopectobacterium sp. NZEC151]MCW2474364.1 flagellar filament capping protein FliD [Candidatus Symbiopectobacterium sp. NZEC151]
MASISFTGSTSGLSSILQQLTELEQTRINPIKTQQTLYTNRSKAFDTLSAAVTKLDTANDALAKAKTINQTTVTSTNTAFAATTANGAVSGSYQVEVQNLATAHSLLSGEFDSNKTQLGATTGGTRTLTISQPGQEKPLEINLTDGQTTLEGIRDAINKANGNVGASIIKADDDSYYLAITSKSTGTDGKMTINVTGDDTLKGKIGYTSGVTGNMSEQVAAENSVIKLNGSVTVTRQSNTVADAIDGVTLTLKAENTAGKPETLSIDTDTAPMEAAVKNWVDAYNALQTTIGTLTKFTATEVGASSPDTSNGVLLGNSTVRGIQTQLKMQLSSAQSGSIANMSQLGVKQNASTGMLEIDSTKLQAALKDNPTAVEDFFVGDGKNTGFATQVGSYLDGVLNSTDGTIKIAKDGIASTIKTLKQTYDRTQQSIDDNITRLKAQFTQLDKLVSQMNSTSDYLTTQLAQLSS